MGENTCKASIYQDPDTERTPKTQQKPPYPKMGKGPEQTPI